MGNPRCPRKPGSVDISPGRILRPKQTRPPEYNPQMQETSAPSANYNPELQETSAQRRCLRPLRNITPNCRRRPLNNNATNKRRVLAVHYFFAVLYKSYTNLCSMNVRNEIMNNE